MDLVQEGRGSGSQPSVSWHIYLLSTIRTIRHRPKLSFLTAPPYSPSEEIDLVLEGRGSRAQPSVSWHIYLLPAIHTINHWPKSSFLTAPPYSPSEAMNLVLQGRSEDPGLSHLSAGISTCYPLSVQLTYGLKSLF